MKRRLPLRRGYLPIGMVFLLMLAMACGSASTATPPPTNTPVPVETPTAAVTPVAAAPTATPQATTIPDGDDIAGPEFAPAFADYWKPHVDYYGQPVRGGILNVVYEDPLDHGNVWGAYTGAAVRLRSATMSKMLGINPYNFDELIPDLARGWTVHDDFMGVTFYFHEGIQWHNVAAFTCEDARFWLETVVTANGLTVSEMRGKLGFVDLETTSCLDDLTLEIGFNEPNTNPVTVFHDRAATIFNKEWFQEGGEEAAATDISVGTGAFMWTPGQRVGVNEQHFERNPNYFRSELPYLDGVVIHGIVDESAQQAAMLSHQGQYHWVRNWGQYDAYVDHEQIATVIRPTSGHYPIWLNKAKPPLDNLRVRQAFYMAIDRESAIEVLMDGHASLGFQMPPGTQWSLDEETGCAIPPWCPPEDGDMERQREEARQILEEENFPFDKTFVMTVESDNQVQQRATFVQEQLRLIGVKVEFDLLETVAWRKTAAEGTWGDILPRNDGGPAFDPVAGPNYLFRCDSTNNHWTPQTECDEKAEELLDGIAGAVEDAERKRLLDELQVYTMENYWRFPLFWEHEAVAFWAEVRGYYHMPASNLSQIKWMHLWIDPAHADDRNYEGQTTGVPGGI